MSSIPKNSAFHQFDVVGDDGRAMMFSFPTASKENGGSDALQVNRCFNLSATLASIPHTRIYVTGVKLSITVSRMHGMNSKLAAKGLNWRFMLGDSVVFNDCLGTMKSPGVHTGNIVFNEGYMGSIEEKGLGFICINNGGTSMSIHQKMIRASGDCETKLDMKGILSHGIKNSVTLNKWVVIKKWLRRDTLYGTDWSRNIYFQMMMEMLGNGEFVFSERWLGISMSGIIYYRHC
jgi:hypothetical protein